MKIDCRNCVGKDVCGCDRPEQPQPMTERERQWKEFSDAVAEHLREYAVPQYGDVGEDEITGYSTEDCVTHLSRYAKRYGTQSRKGQQKLDFMKIAHYAQCAWEKYNDNVDEDEYILTDMDGYDGLGYMFITESTFRGKTIKIYKKVN